MTLHITIFDHGSTPEEKALLEAISKGRTVKFLGRRYDVRMTRTVAEPGRMRTEIEFRSVGLVPPDNSRVTLRVVEA